MSPKRDLRKIKKKISKKAFEVASIAKVTREKRCKILITLAKDKRTTKLISLTKYHKEKCI